MNKIRVVIEHELRTTMLRRSFLFFAFGVPLIAVLIYAGVTIYRSQQQETSVEDETFEFEVEGYVDVSGVIRSIPEEIPQDILVRYETEELANQAMQRGDISAYFIIPEEYLESGKLVYVYPQDKSLLADGQGWLLSRVLMLNLLGEDRQLADMVWYPLDLKETDTAPFDPASGVGAGEDCTGLASACESNGLVQFLPALMAVLFYVFLMSSSSLLVRTVSVEKENRTIEMLLISLKPGELIAGKIIGLGAAGLLQTIAWVGSIYFVLRTGGQTLSLPEGFSIPADLLVWAVLFFIFGYLLYASLMTGVGAMVPKLKEVNQASTLATIPLLAGYIVGLIAPMAQATTGLLVVVLSIFPFTAPILMMMRLADGAVPFWQPVLALALMLVTAYLLFRLVSALFNAQNLLSGQPFSFGRFFKAVLQKG